jgi:hypothetical protein
MFFTFCIGTQAKIVKIQERMNENEIGRWLRPSDGKKIAQHLYSQALTW